MGRELKRKQAKKEGIQLKEEQIKRNEDPYSDIYKLLKTFSIILLIVIAIHFFTALLITKEIEEGNFFNNKANLISSKDIKQ